GAWMRAAREPRGHAPEPFDACGVVDHARAAPHGVVVRSDDDDLVARAGQLGDDVAVGAPADVLGTDDEARVLSLAEPLRVLPGEERRRRLGHVPGGRRAPEERDRPLAEDRADESALADGPDAVRQLPHLAFTLPGVRVHARAGGPALAVDPELRLLGLVDEQ